MNQPIVKYLLFITLLTYIIIYQSFYLFLLNSIGDPSLLNAAVPFSVPELQSIWPNIFQCFITAKAEADGIACAVECVKTILIRLHSQY